MNTYFSHTHAHKIRKTIRNENLWVAGKLPAWTATFIFTLFDCVRFICYCFLNLEHSLSYCVYEWYYQKVTFSFLPRFFATENAADILQTRSYKGKYESNCMYKVKKQKILHTNNPCGWFF